MEEYSVASKVWKLDPGLPCGRWGATEGRGTEPRVVGLGGGMCYKPPPGMNRPG